MKISELFENDKLSLPDIEKGDTIFIGKFKNRKATVTGFKKDDHNQPVLKTTKGDTKLFKPRIDKLDETKIPKPKPENIKDAIEHAQTYGENWKPSDFKIKYIGFLSPDEIKNYDDISSWVEVETPEDLEDFRSGSFSGGPDLNIPPIIVITAPDEDGCLTQIGDGRGRVNWAIAHNKKLHVYHMVHKDCIDKLDENHIPPPLRSAIYFNGKIYIGGKTHLDILSNMPKDISKKAWLDGNNRGYVTDKGKYLSRRAAANYARKNNLYRPGTPDWVINSPEIASEYLNQYLIESVK